MMRRLRAILSVGMAFPAIGTSAFSAHLLPSSHLQYQRRTLHHSRFTKLPSTPQDNFDDDIRAENGAPADTEEASTIFDTNDDKSQAPEPGSLFPIELPIDGSLVVLLPAVGIAVLGIITSIMVISNSADPVLAAPPGGGTMIDAAGQVGIQATERMVENISDATDEACRGLCSSQEEQLENMRSFMNKFAAKTDI